MGKLPKIDLKRLELESNRRQRLEFVKQYVKWLKKTPNEVWAAQHNKFFEVKRA